MAQVRITHPTILLHIVVAAGVLIAAAAAAITSVGRADRWWIAVSGTGLAFVLLAFGSGVEYVDSSQKNALSYMSIGWTGAVIVYGAGWYLGRRKERRQAAWP